jgi:hypothetical protein
MDAHSSNAAICMSTWRSVLLSFVFVGIKPKGRLSFHRRLSVSRSEPHFNATFEVREISLKRQFASQSRNACCSFMSQPPLRRRWPSPPRTAQSTTSRVSRSPSTMAQSGLGILEHPWTRRHTINDDKQPLNMSRRIVIPPIIHSLIAARLSDSCSH